MPLVLAVTAVHLIPTCQDGGARPSILHQAHRNALDLE